MTDNSNYIVDLYFEEPIKDSHAGESELTNQWRSLSSWYSCPPIMRVGAAESL